MLFSILIIYCGRNTLFPDLLVTVEKEKKVLIINAEIPTLDHSQHFGREYVMTRSIRFLLLHFKLSDWLAALFSQLHF